MLSPIFVKEDLVLQTFLMLKERGRSGLTLNQILDVIQMGGRLSDSKFSGSDLAEALESLKHLGYLYSKVEEALVYYLKRDLNSFESSSRGV